MKKRLYCLIVALSFPLVSCTDAPTKKESSSKKAIPRDTFLMLLSSAFNNSCDEPKSPFACMVKTVDVCKKNLPVAVDECINNIRPQLPEEIDNERDDSVEKDQFATCVVSKFVALSGSKSLDMYKCK